MKSISYAIVLLLNVCGFNVCASDINSGYVDQRNFLKFVESVKNNSNRFECIKFDEYQVLYNNAVQSVQQWYFWTVKEMVFKTLTEKGIHYEPATLL